MYTLLSAHANTRVIEETPHVISRVADMAIVLCIVMEWRSDTNAFQFCKWDGIIGHW